MTPDSRTRSAFFYKIAYFLVYIHYLKDYEYPSSAIRTSLVLSRIDKLPHFCLVLFTPTLKWLPNNISMRIVRDSWSCGVLEYGFQIQVVSCLSKLMPARNFAFYSCGVVVFYFATIGPKKYISFVGPDDKCSRALGTII